MDLPRALTPLLAAALLAGGASPTACASGGSEGGNPQTPVKQERSAAQGNGMHDHKPLWELAEFLNAEARTADDVVARLGTLASRDRRESKVDPSWSALQGAAVLTDRMMRRVELVTLEPTGPQVFPTLGELEARYGDYLTMEPLPNGRRFVVYTLPDAQGGVQVLLNAQLPAATEPGPDVQPALLSLKVNERS